MSFLNENIVAEVEKESQVKAKGPSLVLKRELNHIQNQQK